MAATSSSCGEKRLRNHDDETDLQEESGVLAKKHFTEFADIDFAQMPKNTTLARALDGLCYDNAHVAVTLKSLEITQCNAADDHNGIPFSKAYCSVHGSGKVFLMGEIFRNAIDIIILFMRDKELPKNKQQRFILKKLLNYLTDKDVQAPIKRLQQLNETELTTVLVNHLFGKLATSEEFTIDKNCRGTERELDKCPCGKPSCKLTGTYGDTSIGNGEVWHGNVEIIIKNDLVIDTLDEEPDSSGGKSPIDFRLRTTNFAHIIAETIVFSFLQKNRHPESDHFLFPCIGVGSEAIVVYFYDSEHDILLQSSPIPLLNPAQGNEEESVSLTAILVCWMVVNYKYLCSGLTESMTSWQKANFFSVAQKKLHVYENDMKSGGVELSCSSEKECKNEVWLTPFVSRAHLEIYDFIVKEKRDKRFCDSDDLKKQYAKTF